MYKIKNLTSLLHTVEAGRYGSLPVYTLHGEKVWNRIGDRVELHLGNGNNVLCSEKVFRKNPFWRPFPSLKPERRPFVGGAFSFCLFTLQIRGSSVLRFQFAKCGVFRACRYAETIQKKYHKYKESSVNVHTDAGFYISKKFQKRRIKKWKK